jgi:hypothetical protein
MLMKLMLPKFFKCFMLCFVLFSSSLLYNQPSDHYSNAHYADYDDTDSNESYNALCDQIAPTPLPHWRIWLNRCGAFMFTNFLKVRTTYKKIKNRFLPASTSTSAS